MATPIFSQSDLYEMVDGMTHQKFSQVNDRQVTANRAVRFVLSEIDMRSMKRSAPLSPNLFSRVYDYTAPSDLKGNKIIDIKRQVLRDSFEDWLLVDEDQFDRMKRISDYRIAIRDENFNTILRIDGVRGSTQAVLHNCNSLTTNGTWSLTGSTDSTNLTLDTDNFITGGGSLNFDTSAGAATAAIDNDDMTAIDLTKYDEIGSLFVWLFIPDAIDSGGDALTNVILRWGNDLTTNYWERTVTTGNEGLAFFDGWNLLRFDWNGATESGTVNPAAIDSIRILLTKPAGFDADTDWRVDDIVARIGNIYDVRYYSKFGWQNSSGTYLEESSATTDLVIADSEEIEVIALKTAEFAAQELKEREDQVYFRGEYENLKRRYVAQYPSESLKVRRSYGTESLRRRFRRAF